MVFNFWNQIPGRISFLSRSRNIFHQLNLLRFDLPNNMWCISDDTRIGRQATGERKNFVLHTIDVCAASREERVFIAYLRKLALQMQAVKIPSVWW